jgi:radical SAM/Cys-rich protein
MSGYDFDTVLKNNRLTIKPVRVETLWLNITRRCNQSCLHCHVDASPLATEQMDPEVIENCLIVLKALDSIKNLDITGGAPELHPNFEYLVTEARQLGKHVIVRHNLTVTQDSNINGGKNCKHLPSFFADNFVELYASLPHYEEHITDSIRGKGVFDKSIKALKFLNAHGYGQPGSGLILTLVCNQDGSVSQKDRTLLESIFKQELLNKHGILFNRLFVVTNMPINRYLDQLNHSNTFTGYMDSLIASFDPASTNNLACRYLINVGYDGRLYDCDFNQMLNMPILTNDTMTVFNFDLPTLLERRIRFEPHCFGCTAGGGSS